MQTHSPAAARGRVISTFFAIYGGVQAVGMLLAGLVGAGTGLTVALQLQGTLYLVAAGLALRLTRSAARDGNGRIADWASGAHGRIVRGRAR